MKLKSNDAITQEFGQSSASEVFTIKSTGKTFEVLSSKLYKDKISAVIREISCNAYDSHVAAGCADKPFDVHLPTAFDPNFSVRDYGIGLDHEGVMKTFSMFFESTKDDSNDFIGAFGLGSKSPFALVDLFTVTTYSGSERRVYACFKDRGIPHVGLRSTVASNEERGIEISLPINSDDHYRFSDAARTIYKWFDVKPNITGKQVSIADKPVFKDGWAIDKNGHGIIAMMGNVAYPIARDLVDAQSIDLAKGQDALVIEFKVGEIDVQAGREELSYDHVTIQAVKDRITGIVDDIDRKYAEMLKGCRNIFEAQITLTERSKEPEWQALKAVRHPYFNGVKLDYRACDEFLKKHGAYKTMERFVSINDRAYNASKSHKRDDEKTEENPRIPDADKVEEFIIFAGVRQDNRDLQRFNIWVKNNPSKHGYVIRPFHSNFAEEMAKVGIEVVTSDTITLPPRKAKVRSAIRISPRDAEELEVNLDAAEPRHYIITRNLEWDINNSGSLQRSPEFLFNLISAVLTPEQSTKMVYFPVSRIKDIPENWVSYYTALVDHFEKLRKDTQFKKSMKMAKSYRGLLTIDFTWMSNLKKYKAFDEFFAKVEKYRLAYASHNNWVQFEEFHSDRPVDQTSDLRDEWHALKSKYPMVFEITRPSHVQASVNDIHIANADLVLYMEYKNSIGDKA